MKDIFGKDKPIMVEISIIIPVYNKERYICRILGDLKEQKFENFECIIIDDGSTDVSGSLCDKMAQNDKRFLVIHIPNGGVSHARNIGLKKAEGRYVTFIDADDRVDRWYLQQLYEDAICSQADMVIVGYEKFWENSDEKQYTKLPYNGLYEMSDMLSEFALIQQETGVFGFCCGKLIKREVIGQTEFDEKIKLAEDFDFYLRIYPNVRNVFWEQKCKYKYLQRAENSSALVDDSEIDYMSQLFIYLRYRCFLKKMNVYTDINLEIVEQQINNYIFFIVYHSPREKVNGIIKIVHGLCTENDILLKPINFFQKIIFWGICHDAGFLITLFMYMYDSLRKVLKGIK